MMKNKQRLQLIVDYFDAWNRGDAIAVAGYFCKDAVYVDTARNKEYRGYEIEQYITEILAKSAGSIQFSIIEQPVINGDTVFLQSSLKTHSTAENKLLESAEMLKFSGDKIIMLQSYYDLAQDGQLLAQKKNKYAKSGLDQKQIQLLKTKLETIMENDQPYRDSELKLQDLADLLDIRRNHLSQILNNEYQMKFFDFINHHRLQAFLNYLDECDSFDINITELAYDAGFSSSSVFYKTFKRYKDISPSQYIKNIKQLEH